MAAVKARHASSSKRIRSTGDRSYSSLALARPRRCRECARRAASSLSIRHGSCEGTPRVELEANPFYWRQIVFEFGVSSAEALSRMRTTRGLVVVDPTWQL